MVLSSSSLPSRQCLCNFGQRPDQPRPQRQDAHQQHRLQQLQGPRNSPSPHPQRFPTLPLQILDRLLTSDSPVSIMGSSNCMAHGSHALLSAFASAPTHCTRGNAHGQAGNVKIFTLYSALTTPLLLSPIADSNTMTHLQCLGAADARLCLLILLKTSNLPPTPPSLSLHTCSASGQLTRACAFCGFWYARLSLICSAMAGRQASNTGPHLQEAQQQGMNAEHMKEAKNCETCGSNVRCGCAFTPRVRSTARRLC